MDFSRQKPAYTDFRDWSGREFKFNGLVDDVRAETVGGKNRLIFNMKDRAGGSLGDQKFLFVNGGLIKEN